MSERPVPRKELLRPYRHPYRHWVPEAWMLTGGPRTAALGTAAAAGCAVLTLVTGAEQWLALGVAAISAAILLIGYYTAYAAVVITRRIRPWFARTELGDVRQHRPHAGEADPDVVHDEYAVSVDESGVLQLWRFVPLAVDELEPVGDVLVPGRPQHAARLVEKRAFDARDAGRAAEQLHDAQERAAALEAADRERALLSLARRDGHAELAAEARSTAAALQHLTGQRRRGGVRRRDR